MIKNTQYISAYRKANLLYGTIVRSTISSGTVTGISIPNFPESIVVISGKQTPGSNSVRIIKQTMPLFAGEQILYRGQPLLAVFAPTREESIAAAGSITITYQSAAEAPAKEPPPDEIAASSQPEAAESMTPGAVSGRPATPPFPGAVESAVKTVSWGNPARLFEKASRIIEHTYTTGSESSVTTSPTGAAAEYRDGTMVIHAASQWPFHVRNTVSDVCGLPKRKVVVHQVEFHPTHDEKLIHPSMYGAMCALAAMVSGKPARIIDTEPSHRAEMIIKRSTALNAEGEPSAEQVEIAVDTGAFSLFGEEMIKQILTGAVPMYDLHGIKITVRLYNTPTPPRHHFRGLGFSTAIYSTEAHISALAREIQVNPLGWRLKHLKAAESRPSAQIEIKYELLKQLLEDVANRADFYRKYAVYEMQRVRQQNFSPFYRYARGIGIASGYGINGFSRSFSEDRKHSLTVSLEENNMVTVLISVHEPGAKPIWKRLISESLSIDPSRISIICSDTRHVPDTGPDVLQREIYHISNLILRCCESIKSQRFKEPLPIRVKRGFKQPVPKGKRVQQFSGLSWGAVIVELELDTISLEPVIKGIWGSFESGRIFNHDKVTAGLSHALREAVKRCGGVVDDREQPVTIDAVIKESELVLPVSATGNAQGLIAAACSSAVSQALNVPANSLPLLPETILKLLSGRPSS